MGKNCVARRNGCVYVKRAGNGVFFSGEQFLKFVLLFKRFPRKVCKQFSVLRKFHLPVGAVYENRAGFFFKARNYPAQRGRAHICFRRCFCKMKLL